MKMIENVCYVIGRAEEVLHFLVLCDEFEWERQKLLKRIGDIEGSDMWLEEFTMLGKWQCYWVGGL